MPLERVKKLLEPYEGKLSRTVLIGERRSNPSDLLDYVSKYYRELTEKMKLSYSDKANPWDNAPIEAFHALIKREWINRFVPENYEEAYSLVFE